MGACTFIQTAIAKDLETAYRNAVRQAEYDHGHDSYNGTISTTSGVHLFTTTAKQLKDEITAKIARARAKVQDENRRAKLYKRGSDRKRRHQYNAEDAKREVANLVAAKKNLKSSDPYSIASALIDLDKVEKWGCAGAIEITGKRAKEMKAARGYKGKRVKVFVLFGWAAE